MDNQATQTESIAKLTEALAKVQVAMEGAKKQSVNTIARDTKTKYADLASVWDVCRVHLPVNGLAVFQTFARDVEGVTIITTLSHISGEWIKSTLYLPVAQRNNPQAVGSAITYGRRYALSAMVGVVAEDDDGAAASAPAPKQPLAPPPVNALDSAKATEALLNEVNAAKTPDDLAKAVKSIQAKKSVLTKDDHTELSRVYAEKNKAFNEARRAAEGKPVATKGAA